MLTQCSVMHLHLHKAVLLLIASSLPMTHHMLASFSPETLLIFLIFQSVPMSRQICIMQSAFLRQKRDNPAAPVAGR